ncbi:DUF1343 domain-containing protein [Puteibacter caeruleilacunae]|nr:DUF1343 domain-containing protein [Puteibacter caeruleilacunae]
MRLVIIYLFTFLTACGTHASDGEIIVGAKQANEYLHLLKDKRVALVVNQTSVVDSEHLVDFFIREHVNIQTIFAPEHGFRGDAGAGEKISDSKDAKTGIPIISIYGKHRKPLKEDLKDIDIVVFDIQDVGCRFYTYISTMHLVMESCAENDVPFLVLDRPNPHGDKVDGPVRKDGFESFVGLDPIPILHGCTVGELALMINDQGWLKDAVKCELNVVSVKNYTHNDRYSLPIKPSPNLPNDVAVDLYPSLCFFEATSVSVGRGTDFPFQVLGCPDSTKGEFQFTPRSLPHAAPNPLHKEKLCFGEDLRRVKAPEKFVLAYFMNWYDKFENEKDFLTREKWFNLLAGTDKLLEQIRAGMSEEDIRKSWEKELDTYKEMRKKYLLYPDFE